jgi:hypothetical protein
MKECLEIKMKIMNWAMDVKPTKGRFYVYSLNQHFHYDFQYFYLPVKTRIMQVSGLLLMTLCLAAGAAFAQSGALVQSTSPSSIPSLLFVQLLFDGHPSNPKISSIFLL